jgi:tRNA dimethylallyltransferase
LKSQNSLIVIAGPTAVGKTGVSVQMAKKLGCDIISADSRQFYKELSIGTAKPTEDEMSGVTHHFIDFMSVQEEFSAGKFELAVMDLLPKIFYKTNRVIMTGGSGLYIQAVCEGMNDIPDVDPTFRKDLYKELDQHGLETLVEELKVKDPDYYHAVDINNPQRVIRALEICRGSGRPYSSFRQDQKNRRDFQIVKIGLDREREDLFRRIDERIEKMIERGLFDEARRNYPFRHLNALKTVGYKEIFEYIDGKYDYNEAVRLLKRNSRRYAKRQLTWFRKDPEFEWLHPEDLKSILTIIRQRIYI